MKRAAIILITALLVLCSSGCDRQQPIKVLAGSRIDISNRYTDGWCEFTPKKGGVIREPEQQGETMTYEFPEMTRELSYCESENYISQKQILRRFVASDSGNNILVDTETGMVYEISIYVFPDDAVLKTTPVTPEQAKEIAINFIRERYPDMKIDEFGFVPVESEDAEKIELYMHRLNNGVAVETLSFTLDKNGNICKFKYTDAFFEDGPEIPNLTDEDYIAGAKKRLDDYFKDRIYIDKVKDIEIVGEKTNMYISEFDKYAIDYTVRYTVVNTDGTEVVTSHQFYYPYEAPAES